MENIVNLTTTELLAFAKVVAKQTIIEMRLSTMTKSEYARIHKLSRVTVDAMIARDELEVNKHGKIIVQ